MHTDEYQISLNREIGVCRSMIASAEKELARLEKSYGLKTEQALDGNSGRVISERDILSWREEAAAVRLWNDRLREYEELYNGMKK